MNLNQLTKKRNKFDFLKIFITFFTQKTIFHFLHKTGDERECGKWHIEDVNKASGLDLD